jgi:CheY-like chemotaxis protein
MALGESAIQRVTTVSPETGNVSGAPSSVRESGEVVEPRAANPSPQTTDAENWRTSGLVLVVDDEPAVARVTSMVLDQCGFDVAVAFSSRDALARLAEWSSRVRLVLVDLTMPDQDGIEFMRAARELGCQAPMVLTSGYLQDEADRRFVSQGFAGYLQKPYRLETLVDVLRRALGE